MHEEDLAEFDFKLGWLGDEVLLQEAERNLHNDERDYGTDMQVINGDDASIGSNLQNELTDSIKLLKRYLVNDENGQLMNLSLSTTAATASAGLGEDTGEDEVDPGIKSKIFLGAFKFLEKRHSQYGLIYFTTQENKDDVALILVEGMKINIDRPDAQKIGCNISSNLLLNHDYSKSLINYHIMETAYRALEIYQQNDEIVSEACNCLWNLSYSDHTFQKKIVDLGAIELIHKMLTQDNKCPQTLSSMFGLCQNLIHREADIKRKVIDLGFVPILVHAFETHQKNNELFEACTWFLSSLAFGNIDVSRQLLELNTVKKVVAIADIYASNKSIQKPVQCLIIHMSGTDEINKGLLEQGGADFLLRYAILYNHIEYDLPGICEGLWRLEQHNNTEITKFLLSTGPGLIKGSRSVMEAWFQWTTLYALFRLLDHKDQIPKLVDLGLEQIVDVAVRDFADETQETYTYGKLSVVDLGRLIKEKIKQSESNVSTQSDSTNDVEKTKN